MTGSVLELLMLAFIIIGISVAIWKTGQRNPVSTGKIEREMTRMDGKLKGLGQKVSEIDKVLEQAAKASDVKAVQDRLGEHDAHLCELQKSVAELSKEGAASHADIKHVKEQVDRLYNHIVAKGMNS